MVPHKTLLNLCFLGAALAAGASEPGAYTRIYGPRANMLVAKPTLRWEIWPGKNSRITEEQMLVNGTAVPAQYSAAERALLYTPARPLPPGDYKVKCRVVIDHDLVANKEWTFSVAENAARELPGPDQDQLRAFDAANAYRSALGLESFQLDNRMSAAALAHSKYLALNKTTGHFQKPGTPGFFGAQPGDRLECFGYVQDSWECVSFGCDSPNASVAGLVNAPYHRIPFLQPGQISIGTGYHERRLTMEFGAATGEGIVVYPTSGQNDVPTRWGGNERPNPLRLHDAQSTVGYIIVFSVWQQGGCKIALQDATLRSCADGSTVQLFLNTPANDDHLDNACFLIPKRALRPGTTYEASVRATIEPYVKGRPAAVAAKSWRFTTSTQP